jgi:hypothetical protein
MTLQVSRVFHNGSVRVFIVSWELHYGSMYVPRVFYDGSITVATRFRESSVTTVLRFHVSSIMDPF